MPIPYKPHDLSGVDWVLITHEHMDHCDPHTIPLLAEVNPSLRFIAPCAVRQLLQRWGINADRIDPPPITDIDLGNGLYVHSIAAAHPIIRHDQDGFPLAVSYVFTYRDRVLYAAGDTSVSEEIITILKNYHSIDVALLPVNEDNFFRRRRGIVGNMSVREAFELAREVKIKKVIPVHWDMLKSSH